MRYTGLIAIGAFLIGWPPLSRAEQAVPRIEACATAPGVLGLSRIVEIDARDGPRFGGTKSPHDFLNDGEVVLTFDDGPLRPYTRAVMKALAAHCTKATFFMVGRMAVADPAMVKEVAAAGHTLAAHTWSHKNLKPLGILKGRPEFELGFSAVAAANGAPIAPLFRFPYLSDSRQVADYAATRHIGIFGIDIDSKDYLTRDPAEARRRILSQLAVRRKGIILMHDIQPSTAHGIKELLDALHANGYKVVHIVPRDGATTLAAYDAKAEQAIASKAAKVAANPLAARSVVWTAPPAAVAPETTTAAPAPSRPKKVTSGAKTVKPAQPSAGETLPWQTGNPSKSDAPVPRRLKEQKPEREDPTWQPRFFD